MKILALGTALLLTLPALANDNLVANGSFEAPFITDRYQLYVNGESFGGWTVSQGSIDLTFSIWNAAEGRQAVDLVGFNTGNGAIFQDISTQVGQSYSLKFAVAPTPVSQTFQMQALWGTTVLATVTRVGVSQSPPEPYSPVYDYVEFGNLVATSTTTRLTLASINAPNLTQGMIVDNVSVSAIPEPSAFASFSIGIAALSCLWLRRKRPQSFSLRCLHTRKSNEGSVSHDFRSET